jgi:ornithine cyclodeaminase
MIVIDAETTRARLPFARLLPALRQMFAAGCEVPLRHSHQIGSGETEQGTLLLMPAWRESEYLGVKLVNIFPGNSGRGLPGLYSTYLLYDAGTGKPLALIDGNEITSRRTAAASALAASYLARQDARTLLVVGAGRVGSLLAEAYRSVRPIERVFVWDIDPVLGAALAARLQALQFDASVATDLQAAVQEADIVSCATLSTTPLIRGRWLQPGCHLDLIGSFTPAMREADEEAFRRSAVFVDTQEALMKSGDLLTPIASGAFLPDELRATLDALCQGRHAGRRTCNEITLFKAVGTALEDLAAATLVYRAETTAL